MNQIHLRTEILPPLGQQQDISSLICPGWQVLCGLSVAKYQWVPFPSRISTEPGHGVSTLLHPLFQPFSGHVCTANHCGIGFEHANCIPDREQQLYFTLKLLYHYNLGCKCNSLISSDFFLPSHLSTSTLLNTTIVHLFLSAGSNTDSHW